jgi:hypothetical protein
LLVQEAYLFVLRTAARQQPGKGGQILLSFIHSSSLVFAIILPPKTKAAAAAAAAAGCLLKKPIWTTKTAVYRVSQRHWLCAPV